MSEGADFTSNLRDALPDRIAEPVGSVVDQVLEFDPIDMAHRVGIRSRHAYIGGFASIALAIVAWSVSRARPNDSKGQSDRWGIFIGHWAPTFFAVGLALKEKEKE